MQHYLRSLKRRDPAAKQRFVVGATIVSFGVIVLLWMLLGLISRALQRTPFDAAQGKPTPEGTATPTPSSTPNSLTDLLSGTASPRPLFQPTAPPSPSSEPTV